MRNLLFFISLFGALATGGGLLADISVPSDQDDERDPAAVESPAQESPEAKAPAGPEIDDDSIYPGESQGLAFRLGGLLLLQPNGELASGEITWAPRFAMSDRVEWAGHLGAALLRGGANRGNFLSVRVQTGLTYWVEESSALELLAGAQSWFGNGGTSVVISVNGVVSLGEAGRSLFFERIYFGYGHFFLRGNATHELRLGIGVKF